ncbi:fluoride efflux transporter CrcB [Bacillus sp. REN10]|uniref:fluoride efflux transporter CrcB n=1 Tax=Bacillus sp. REN10 TaxID=2782541 RepID=UPI00193B9CA1|nr:fluoride efflux transporter CrcB [Bacillus sp. REN10]
MNIVLVAIGGGIGAVFRYIFSGLNEMMFPFGTLLINIAGSFILGVVTARFMRKKITKKASLFYGTGFCGGFTTMSTFSKEVVELWQTNMWASAGYVIISVTAGIMASAVGLKAGGKR